MIVLLGKSWSLGTLRPFTYVEIEFLPIYRGYVHILTYNLQNAMTEDDKKDYYS